VITTDDRSDDNGNEDDSDDEDGTFDWLRKFAVPISIRESLLSSVVVGQWSVTSAPCDDDETTAATDRVKHMLLEVKEDVVPLLSSFIIATIFFVVAAAVSAVALGVLPNRILLVCRKDDDDGGIFDHIGTARRILPAVVTNASFVSVADNLVVGMVETLVIPPLNGIFRSNP